MLLLGEKELSYTSVPLIHLEHKSLSHYMFVGVSFQMTSSMLIRVFKANSNVNWTEKETSRLHTILGLLCWMNERFSLSLSSYMSLQMRWILGFKYLVNQLWYCRPNSVHKMSFWYTFLDIHLSTPIHMSPKYWYHIKTSYQLGPFI